MVCGTCARRGRAFLLPLPPPAGCKACARSGRVWRMHEGAAHCRGRAARGNRGEEWQQGWRGTGSAGQAAWCRAAAGAAGAPAAGPASFQRGHPPCSRPSQGRPPKGTPPLKGIPFPLSLVPPQRHLHVGDDGDVAAQVAQVPLGVQPQVRRDRHPHVLPARPRGVGHPHCASCTPATIVRKGASGSLPLTSRCVRRRRGPNERSEVDPRTQSLPASAAAALLRGNGPGGGAPVPSTRATKQVRRARAPRTCGLGCSCPG